MSFLGGLAGTLGKILEAQDAEQRREASQMRAEDRADMRAFNKEDNIYEKDGKMFSSITLSNGQVIEKELSPKAVAKYNSEQRALRASDVSSDKILEGRNAYLKGIADGTIKAGTTQEDWEDTKKRTGEIADYKIKSDIDAKKEVKVSNLTAKARAEEDPLKRQKLILEIMKLQGNVQWQQHMLNELLGGDGTPVTPVTPKTGGGLAGKGAGAASARDSGPTNGARPFD